MIIAKIASIDITNFMFTIFFPPKYENATALGHWKSNTLALVQKKYIKIYKNIKMLAQGVWRWVIIGWIIIFD